MQTAFGSNLSENGSNKTATPSSELTSSDEAYSSCQEGQDGYRAMEKELNKIRKVVEMLEKENLQLKWDFEAHKTEMEPLKELLNNSQKQETEQAKVEALCEDLTNMTCENVHALYRVYRKSLSHNKNLIYQKKYLLNVLKDLQLAQKVILSYVNRNIPYENRSTDSSITAGHPLRGRAFFRSVAFVAVAIQRMKYCVSKWRLLARVPSVDIITAEVRSCFSKLP